MHIGGNFPDGETTHDGSGRIGAMRRVGNQDFPARVIVMRDMIGTNHRYPSKLALGASHGRQRDRVHPSHFPQHFLQLIQAG